MELSPDAVLKLQEFRTDLSVEVGSVVWLPAHRIQAFQVGKDRFWLVAGIERTTGGTPPVVHVIPGTTKASTGRMKIIAEADEAGLSRRTYFKVMFASTTTVETITNDGVWKGRLDEKRIPDIKAAIMASNKVALKRVWMA